MATKQAKMAVMKNAAAKKFDEKGIARVPAGQPGGGQFASSGSGSKTKLSVDDLSKKFYDDSLGMKAMKEAAEKAWDENATFRHLILISWLLLLP